MSYIIPRDECTLTDLRNFRDAAVEKGIQRAVELRIVTDRKQLVVRGFQNIADAGAALDQWRTTALVAIGAEYGCFQNAAVITLAPNRLVVFYKIGVEEIPMPVSLLRFRLNAMAGNITAAFDLEQLINSLVSEGYFSQPVIIDPNTLFTANVVCRINTGAFTRVQLGAYTIEPVGGIIA